MSTKEREAIYENKDFCKPDCFHYVHIDRRMYIGNLYFKCHANESAGSLYSNRPAD